jgi:exodeoxyribonuclease VII large subunit
MEPMNLETARPWTASERPVWGVGALLNALADTLQARFNPVRVRGEVSGFSRAASGHCYFSLKDAQGQIRCALFRRAAMNQSVDWRDGLLVDVDGRLDVYGPRGDLQLIVESAQVAGQGGLFEQFMRLKAALDAEGCFDPARKRLLPRYPARILVVTSLDAAALRDVVTTLHRRVPHLPVRVFPSPVQGDAAPAALCEALERAYQVHAQSPQRDVLLLVRGGGSLEDLWAFNSPLVVRKVIEAPMPLICGVGHETDFTLADFAADVRAPTPTAAAELCAPTRESQTQSLDALEQLLSHRARRQMDQQAQRIDRLGMRLGRPMERLNREREQLTAWAHRMQATLQRRTDRDAQSLFRWPVAFQAAGQRQLARQRDRLAYMEARLRLLDPRLVLQRGYTLLTDEQGRAVTSVTQLQAGQPVVALLADGQADLTVKALGT